MWFWKIFMISFSLASIWLDRCGCAPYNYFGVGDIVAKSDVRPPRSESGSRKTLVTQVPETKSTNNIPTRGLFYPDDMFFTNRMLSESSTEKCATDKPSVMTSSGFISKSTLNTKNNDKSTKYQTTLAQKKPTVVVKSSLRRQQTTTLAVLSPKIREEETSSFAVPSISRGQRKSTFKVKSSTSHEQTSSFAVPNTSRRQKAYSISLPISSNHQKMTTFVAPSLPRRRRTTTIVMPSSSKGVKDFIFEEQNMTNSQLKSEFTEPSTTIRQRKYFVRRSSNHDQNSTHISKMTTTDITPDVDYLSYSEVGR